MLLSNEEQNNRRQKDRINEKIEDLKYYEEQVIPQLQELKEQKYQKEKERLMNIKKYKEELDKQCIENRKIKLGIYNTNFN